MPATRAGLLVLCLAAAGCSSAKPTQPLVPMKTDDPPPTPPPPPQPPPPRPDDPVKLAVPQPPKADAPPDPWVVGRAPEPGSFAPVPFPDLGPYAVTGLAARPEVDRAVVTIRVEKKGAAVGTRVALCDTTGGKVLSTWELAGEFAALDLSPDGRTILASAPQAGKGRNTLRLWAVGSDGQLKRWSWAPHTVPAAHLPGKDGLKDAEAVDVRWAAFVGNDRVVSISRAGQLRVFDPDGTRLLATLDATPCRPAVTPDGTRVAFLAGEEVALLDPAGGRVGQPRRVGPPPPHPALAFSPDGTRLAVGGNGKAILLETATGAARHVVLPKLRVNEGGAFDKSFGWAGDRYLYSDQQVHDPSFPLPVWDYLGAVQGQFRGYQLWACVRTGGAAAVRPYTLPHVDARPLVTAAKARPGLFVLKPGGGVRIDLAGVPGERREAVKAALEARLRELGYVPDPAAPATLFASVDPVGTPAGAHYPPHGTIPFARRPARLRLVLNDRELWSEAWAINPPFTISLPPGAKPADAAAAHQFGEPDYDLFARAPVPAYVLGPGAPQGSLGASEFTAGGLRDLPPR
ncbi:MAG: hypothetical protein C0501_24730 [Isosphaera sp.]|nr:hypothetical protein [Isosphaera sp.]